MTAEQALQDYIAAIHNGDWEGFVSDGFTTFVVNNVEQARQGKEAYLKGAGDFLRMTTAVNINQKMIDGNQVALIAQYSVRSPKDTEDSCDMAEFLTFDDEKLTASSIFFDAKALGILMQS